MPKGEERPSSHPLELISLIFDSFATQPHDFLPAEEKHRIPEEVWRGNWSAGAEVIMGIEVSTGVRI